uniref:Kunitz/Bovine pancreatic trypsin inhibitor domain protein n=1 Tax=Rhabditophanes sp. KR3021 TaxID=114890 RepID=A0AC35TNF6_9BILA
MNGRCQSPQSRFKREGISGSGRVLDQCNFNTDCLGGMFCLGGACNCLSNYVAIQGYCYIKKNPGESGCQYNEQCSAVWPESTCKQSKCECPEDVNGVPYVMSRTRDGVVCILHSGEDGDSTPKCPLPEYDDDLLSMPVSQLRNPAMTDPDDQDIPMGEHINPLQFCNTKSTDYTSFVANGGGACVYGQEPFSQGNGIYIADLYDCVGAPSAMSNVKSAMEGNGIYIADLYDCVGAPSAMSNVKSAMEGVYDISKNADGICCMSRAMTCSQPKREANTGSSAPASGVRPRWWYNQITNNCEQFLFNGWQEDEMQSPNNFKTRDHCMAYCSDDSSCKKGSPQYMSGPILNEDEPIGNCQTASSCGSGFECHSKGSQSLCCQTVASLCSNSGGRPIDLLRTTNFDPGFTMKKTFSLNYPSTSRYYYDSDQNRCIAFTFLGGFGNFNNFASSQECDLFCGKLVCSIGSPLKIGNQNQKCASNTDCPSSYECSSDHSVCCPRKQSVCSQPLRLGDCKNSVKRYWYNAGQKTCEMFFYTGCQGNDNSFSSKSECEGTCSNVVPEPQCTQGEAYKDYQGNYYVSSNSVCPINYEPFFDTNINTNVCCPSKSYTCSLSSHKGVVCGSGSSFRYFFNSKTQECQSFAYDGCDGNSNNFATIKDCQEYCGVGNCANGGVPEINEFGQLIVCSDSNKCPSSDTECVSLNQGFSIINRCCPTRIHVCSMPVKNGMGSSASTRFYFNKIIKECTPFTYNGNGNLNSFPSLQACNNYCLSATCAAGENAYLNPNTNTPYECNPSLTTSCPRNYRCIYNSLTELHICCGTPPTASDVCEDSAKAYMNIDGTVKECLINIDGSCPSNYLCTFNSKNRGKYYCCKTENFCPIGKSVFKDSSSKSPIRCTISGTNNQCPDNHSCQSEIRNAFQGYCCSSREVCPNNAEFFVEENTQMPRSCTIGAFITCPNGFSCQSVDNSAISGFCCKGEITSAASDGCPPDFDFI